MTFSNPVIYTHALPGYNIDLFFLDNINLGLPDGRRIAFSFKDPELVNIIINLLPAPLKQKVKNIDLKMDKFVLLRVLLTYLSNMKWNICSYIYARMVSNCSYYIFH